MSPPSTSPHRRGRRRVSGSPHDTPTRAGASTRRVGAPVARRRRAARRRARPSARSDRRAGAPRRAPAGPRRRGRRSPRRRRRARRDPRGAAARASGVVLEQDRGAQRPGLAQERGEGRPQLLGAERVVLEERQLPAVERLGEVRVAVGEPEAREQLGRDACAELVQPLRVALRARWRRSGAPAGCRTGRPSRVSNSTGPAASGAAVASRIALTASAISRGGVGDVLRRRRAPSAARARSTDRPRARSPAAGAPSPPANGGRARRRRPRGSGAPGASSRCRLTLSPTSGAIAAYVRRSPNSERSSSP